MSASPAPVADALISMHVAGLCTVRWTRRIDDDEWLEAVPAHAAGDPKRAGERDFPSDVVLTHGPEVIHPDDFLVFQLDLDPIPALAAFKEMRQRFRKPPMDAEAFATMFERNSLAATADRLREAAELI